MRCALLDVSLCLILLFARVKQESCAPPGSKACHEKQRRDKLNERFNELCAALDPSKPPTPDKLDILRKAMGLLSQLRTKADKLKKSNESFQENMKNIKALIMRLRNDKKIDKHRGCVNTVSFNPNRKILALGSDDRNIILWDWDASRVKFQFNSGHSSNVFQARFMPFTDDKVMVTCALMERQVKILKGGKVQTTFLGVHEGRAHKLAIEPASPYIFYACCEDGLVQPEHKEWNKNTRINLSLFMYEEGAL